MTDDYRDRIAEAIAEWALAYPIASWHLAQGDAATQLAKRWGEQAAKRALAVRDEELERAITHDRQPYPTQWAYDQACAALEKHRERADQAERERDELTAELRTARERLTRWEETPTRPEWTVTADADTSPKYGQRYTIDAALVIAARDGMQAWRRIVADGPIIVSDWEPISLEEPPF